MDKTNTRRQLVNRLENRNPFTGVENDNFAIGGIESVRACRYIAGLLFRLIEEHHGRARARQIFAKLGTPPTVREIGDFEKLSLLNRFDNMDEPNVAKLARQLVEENKALPREERFAAKGVSVRALDKLIRDMIRLRKTEMAKNTWWGPFPPNLAELRDMRAELKERALKYNSKTKPE